MPESVSQAEAGTLPVHSGLLQMVLGYRRTQVINVAAHLRLADILADGPKSSEDIAAATGTDLPSLRRLLRALACVDVVAETEPDVFAATELAEPLRTDTPNSIRHLIMLFCDEGNWRAWGELSHSVRTGKTALEHIYGERPFAYLARDPERSEIFNRAMGEYTKITASSITAGYDFSQLGTLVDVGGNDGTLMIAILEANPGLSGVLFDTPAGVKAAHENLAAASLTDRCRVVEGDFFDSLPEGGDAYVLKSILHDWDSENAVKILRNCRKVVPDDGRLLLVESILPDRINGSGEVLTGTVLMDLNMLVTTGGRERTESEFVALLEAAGFRYCFVTDPVEPSNYRIIEARPA